MGVKGLFQFLKRFEKGIHIPSYVIGKRIGVDIFWLLHKSRGDLFSFQNYILQVVKNAKEVVCVFDGHPSEEKLESLKEQRAKRKEILDTIERIEKFIKHPFARISGANRYLINGYLLELRREAWIPTPEYIETVTRWLNGKGCTIINAVEEADNVLFELANSGKVDAVITNDSDLIILGCKNVIRMNTPINGRLYDTQFIKQQINFTDKMWQDFMQLCKSMKEKDVCLAYSLISVYKDLEYALQKYDNTYKEDLVETIDFVKLYDLINTPDSDD